MPDWKKVIKEIATAVEEASREAKAKPQTKRKVTTRRTQEPNRCLFWDCDTPIRADHILCYDHFGDLQDGLIDECPGCGLAKDVQYEVCLDCYRAGERKPKPTRATAKTRQTKKAASTNTWYRQEYSPAWEAGDATASQFFVYILKLDGGGFYPGQTRELRERLSEHRDGRVKTTAGKHPKLQWFGILPTREAATSVEVELKKLVDSNPRQVRRMVIGFKDLVEELDYR